MRGKKLGLLWFGAWKNAQCYYAPEWVKTDLNRFKRAERPHIDTLCFEEGKFVNGEWKMIRRLNGDEVAVMRYEEPVLLKIKLFVYS